jgi:hypothetical protein
MHGDLRPAMDHFIRRGDATATEESIQFTLSPLRIAEAAVDCENGGPEDDDPAVHDDTEPTGDEGGVSDRSTQPAQPRNVKRKSDDASRIECPRCRKWLVKKKKESEIRKHKCTATQADE